MVCIEEREDSSNAEMLSLRDVGVQPTPVHTVDCGLGKEERDDGKEVTAEQSRRHAHS